MAAKRNHRKKVSSSLMKARRELAKSGIQPAEEEEDAKSQILRWSVEKVRWKNVQVQSNSEAHKTNYLNFDYKKPADKNQT